jgi:hypothetical protein
MFIQLTCTYTNSVRIITAIASVNLSRDLPRLISLFRHVSKNSFYLMSDSALLDIVNVFQHDLYTKVEQKYCQYFCGAYTLLPSDDQPVIPGQPQCKDLTIRERAASEWSHFMRDSRLVPLCIASVHSTNQRLDHSYFM